MNSEVCAGDILKIDTWVANRKHPGKQEGLERIGSPGALQLQGARRPSVKDARSTSICSSSHVKRRSTLDEECGRHLTLSACQREY